MPKTADIIRRHLKECNVAHTFNYEGWLLENYRDDLKLCRNSAHGEVKTLPLILAFHNFADCGEQLRDWCDDYRQVAKEFKNFVDFFINDLSVLCNKIKWLSLDHHELRTSGKPIIYGVDLKNRRYLMKADFNKNALKKFVQQLLQNKLFKSELAVAQPKDSIVVTAIGTTIDSILNAKKDIIIIFHDSAKSQRVQKLQKDFQMLGNKLRNEKQLLFVQMNCIQNYVPVGFRLKNDHTPACCLVPKKQKFAVKYARIRDTESSEALLKFVARNCSMELKHYDREGMPRNKAAKEHKAKEAVAHSSWFNKKLIMLIGIAILFVIIKYYVDNNYEYSLLLSSAPFSNEYYLLE